MTESAQWADSVKNNKMEKVVELVGQGFVINGANPSSFNLFGPGGALNQGEEKGDRPNE